MEELTIEEKAKRYDEAIEKLRSLHDDYDNVSTLIDIKEELEHIFPELTESDDERVRKEMLEYCHKRMNGEFSSITIHQVERWLAWLEKQKPVEWSEEDNNRFKNLCDVIDKSDWNAASKEGFKNWLKSFRPRSNQEIDEQIETIAMHLDNCGDTAMAEILRSCNLCPQNHWKPSDAQMDSIKQAVSSMKASPCYDSEIVSLYNDLKKLKEG